ncbi:LytS/YhcK type 5TM receptor domain-containing protein, partial [Proteus vulgaris]
VEGLIGGLVHRYYMKRGEINKIFNPVTASCATFVAELLQMLIILLLARPFDEAVELVRSIVAPMLVANTIGAAMFIRILL